jgi:hypothetical protein
VQARHLGQLTLGLALTLALLTACSPEATRTRNGGPGADTGNRGATVELHGRSDMFRSTPSVGRAVGE